MYNDSVMTEASLLGPRHPLSSAPAYTASFRHLSDLYPLAQGCYASISGFMNAKETRSVCETMHLTRGEPSSIPLMFPVDEEAKSRLGSADSVVLLDAGQVDVPGSLTISPRDAADSIDAKG